MKKIFNLFVVAFFINLIVFFAPTFLVAANFDYVVVRVVDGDTVIVKKKSNGTELKVELFGIDAPEIGQDFSKEAKEFLERTILNKKIKLTIKSKAQENYSAEVWVLSGYMVYVNEKMVRQGLAWSVSENYMFYEKFARNKKKGLWSEDNPIPPVNFRAEQAKLKRKDEFAKKKADEVAKKKADKSFDESFYKDYYAGVRHSAPQQDTSNTQGNLNSDKEEKKSLSLNDVDLVFIRAFHEHTDNVEYKTDSILEIYLDYKSRSTGNTISWREGTADYSCKVTGIFNSGQQKTIARKDESLSNSSDDIFIDIPKRHLRDEKNRLVRGYVECTIDTGQDFRVKDTFYVSN